MKYQIEPCTEEEEELIDETLEALNDAIVQPEEGAEDKHFVFKITDEAGTILAGCIVYVSNWKLANLDVLWVAEKYRRRGLGSALIRAAEKAAREGACHTMILGTFDFQARPLYEKHGYTLCGTVRDFPRGHANYTLRKRLDQSGQEYVPSRDISGRFEIRTGDEEDAEFIGARLGEYNATQATRAHKYIPLNKKLVDEGGKRIAAIFAGAGTWNQFDIDMIWVDEPYRNQGLGSELLAETEREAKEQGAYFALVWGVFDWQIGFFLKNGYTAVGTLEDCPEGHVMYVLEKRF